MEYSYERHCKFRQSHHIIANTRQFPASLPTANELVKLTSDYVNTTITNFAIFRHTHMMMTRGGVETDQDKETHHRADPVDNCGPGDECLTVR